MATKTQASAKFAFQCKNCGAIEPAEAAGENPVPGACHICRHGVRFEMQPDGTGFTVIKEPDNWIILADLSDSELAKDFKRHGLKSSDVAEPNLRAEDIEESAPADGGPQAHVRHTRESLGGRDKTR